MFSGQETGYFFVMKTSSFFPGRMMGYMKTGQRVFVYISLAFLLSGRAWSVEPPPLHRFESIHSDSIGNALQSAFVWTNPPALQPGAAVAFRKTFELLQKPAQARLHLFADARYILWVNGTYIDRGPNRFQPNGPEYDTIELGPHLITGKNAIAILVVGNLSGGKVMSHPPGLTALLEVSGKTLFHTDESWKWSDGTRFRECGASWANLGETVVDARVEDGDWTTAGYNDALWKPASPIEGDGWGALTARRIPMLREKAVPFTLRDNATLPATLGPGQRLAFDTGRIVQAYPVLELTAEPDTELVIEPFGVRYLAKAGPQSHFTIDTRGITAGAIVVKKGSATVTGLKLIERLYPFDRAGSFTCNDAFLNKLWALGARSVEVLSEDAYVDCADRERVEWMDCDPPVFDVTRVAMAAPGPNGNPIFGDPRLLGEMVRRTALTLQPEGWVKAHTCSDRYDKHAKMEDRACEWVTGIRRYYDASGDVGTVRETWPAVVAQLDYFLQRRSTRGLVLGREWVVWGNPVGYVTLEGAGLNAWVYRALADAAFLGKTIGEAAAAQRFEAVARDLAKAFNDVLWDEKTGAFHSGWSDGQEIKNLKTDGHLVEPTVYAAIFALDRGIVSPEHRPQVLQYVLANRDLNGRMMIDYYLLKLLYAEDSPQLDKEILDRYRTRWSAMVASPMECSWEFFSGGSKAHCYGLFPTYFLSTWVLGVRRDEAVPAKKLIIEPHLGDLTEASGRVLTEFGPVDVAWKLHEKELSYEITVPSEVTAILKLPCKNKPRIESTLPAGKTSGRIKLE